MIEEAVGSDVSIPYDAAAQLAYDEWRTQYNKGAFDEKRFANFKNNYETITVANVIAKKRAREEGTVSLSLLTLNEFGDLSELEYKLAMQKGAAPTTTGDVLSRALEAAELQSQASNALGEAADALAEEEEVRILERCFWWTRLENGYQLQQLIFLTPCVF
jgi:Cathepsin propeptide inhibitor domain (I29)